MYNTDRLRDLKRLAFDNFEGYYERYFTGLTFYKNKYGIDDKKAEEDIHDFINKFCDVKPALGGNLEIRLRTDLKSDFIDKIQ